MVLQVGAECREACMLQLLSVRAGQFVSIFRFVFDMWSTFVWVSLEREAVSAEALSSSIF